MRFTDDQRRRLAARAKVLGRKLLLEVATLVTPDTLLAWHRKLIAQKYDGHDKRGPGRPRIGEEPPRIEPAPERSRKTFQYPTQTLMTLSRPRLA
jgi:hypothetical protein